MKVELSAQELAAITAWGAYVAYDTCGIEPLEGELLIRLQGLRDEELKVEEETEAALRELAEDAQKHGLGYE